MKNLLSILALVAFFSCSQPASEQGSNAEPETSEKAPTAAAANSLTDEEKADGWKLLFDGTTSEGWRGYNQTSFPAAWKIEDGAFFLTARDNRTEEEAADAGDIIYDQTFDDFHFKVDWKISENGNSGIFYLGQETPDKPIYITAPEMQVLDNVGHPDATQGKNGNRKSGSLYDLIPADPQNANPPGEWNTAEVIKEGTKVTHLQNGEEVLAYDFGTDEWKELVAGSKFPGLNEDWAILSSSGYFGLQDHRDAVWFRNIKLKEL